MLYSEWVHPDYEVKIEYMSELKQMVDSQGYIQRAFGISSGIFELLSHINRDTLIQELRECVVLAEPSALMALDVLAADEEYEEYAYFDIEAYYVNCEFVVDFDDDVKYKIHICVNQREQSPGYHKRFMCVLTLDEVKTYHHERDTGQR